MAYSALVIANKKDPIINVDCDSVDIKNKLLVFDTAKTETIARVIEKV